MNGLLDRIGDDAPLAVVIGIVILLIVGGVVRVVAPQWFRTRRAEIELAIERLRDWRERRRIKAANDFAAQHGPEHLDDYADVVNPPVAATEEQQPDDDPPSARKVIVPRTSGHRSVWQRATVRSDTLFSDDATALIHQVSRGLPRAVNNLAVQALVAAYAGRKPSSTNPAHAPPSPRSQRNERHRDTLNTTTTTRRPRPRRLRRRGLFTQAPRHHGE